MSDGQIKEIIKYDGGCIYLHREDGSAWIEYDENGKTKEKAYYINGRLHIN